MPKTTKLNTEQQINAKTKKTTKKITEENKKINDTPKETNVEDNNKIIKESNLDKISNNKTKQKSKNKSKEETTNEKEINPSNDNIIQDKLIDGNIYNIDSEPDINIDLNKIIKYNLTSTDGNIMNDPQFTYYGVHYGKNLEDFDVINHNELQNLLNAQMVQNHIKLHRVRFKSPEGESELLKSEDIDIIAKVKAWKAIKEKLISLKDNQ